MHSNKSRNIDGNNNTFLVFQKMDLISTGLESLIDTIVSKKIGVIRAELSEVRLILIICDILCLGPSKHDILELSEYSSHRNQSFES